MRVVLRPPSSLLKLDVGVQDVPYPPELLYKQDPAYAAGFQAGSLDKAGLAPWLKTLRTTALASEEDAVEGMARLSIHPDVVRARPPPRDFVSFAEQRDGKRDLQCSNKL